MKTRILAVLLAFLSLGVFPTSANAAPPNCWDIAWRKDLPSGRELYLTACPHNHPGHPGSYLYQARIQNGHLGDHLTLAYYPYHTKGFVPGSGLIVEGSFTGTDWFYGLPGELQACMNTNFSTTLFCTW